MVSDDIGLVTIHNFDSRCAEETIAAIEDLLEEGAEKLIFDVRFNPGGFAHELVKVLDYLLPEGEVFHTVDYAGREQIDTSDASCLEVPMAVLVNGESYSAAEFFAVALQEYGVGIVVGEKTSGKGHFQQTYRLNDGSSVNLSVGKYFTPSGKSLEGVGITPDIELTVEPEAAFEILAGITPDAEGMVDIQGDGTVGGLLHQTSILDDGFSRNSVLVTRRVDLQGNRFDPLSGARIGRTGLFTAGGQGQDHGDSQQQRNKLFHSISSLFFLGEHNPPIFHTTIV